MVFFVSVVVTVEGVVRNMRFRFYERPTLHELVSAVESHCTRATLPLLESSFLVDAMMLFDEYTRRWVELYSAAQLSTDCQLCALQVHAMTGRRAKKGLLVKTDARNCPTSVPPPSVTIACVAPARDASSSPSSSFCSGLADSGVAACRSSGSGCCCRSGNRCCSRFNDKRRIYSDGSGQRRKMRFGEQIRALFDNLDERHKGYLLYTDIRRAVSAQRRNFINYSAEALFALADQDGDGHVSYREWVNFAVDHPWVVDTLLHCDCGCRYNACVM